MAKYQTTVTKKDGTKVSGYIENDVGYYDDGTAIGAGDSIVDAQGKTWTKPDTAATSAGGATSGTRAGTPSTVDLINDAIRKNNSGGGGSSSGSYRVSGIDKPIRSSYLRSAKELADLYDINYDMAAIRSLYDEATNAKYELLSKEREQAENDFYTNNANANATLLDTLRKATSSAIATGASRGLAGAEQLGLMMEQQQAITDEATNLAQERANMADEIAAEKAQNIINALEYSNQLKQGLATNSANIYSADTQYDVGELDWAAQMKNVEALFEQIAAEKDVNLKAQELDALKALLDKEIADADRVSNEKIAADNAAAQQAYYNYMMKNAGSSGSGSGSNQEGDNWDAIWNKGDRNQAVKYLREHWGMTWQEANEKLNSDQQFLLNEKYGGYAKVPKNLKDAGEVKIIVDKTAVDIAKDASKNNTGAKTDVYRIVYEDDGSQTVWYKDGTHAIIPADLGSEKSKKPDYSHLRNIPAQFTAGPSK